MTGYPFVMAIFNVILIAMILLIFIFLQNEQSNNLDT